MNKEFFKKLIFAPILPLVFIINLAYFNMFNSYLISIVMTITSALCLYLLYSFVKLKATNFINSSIIITDWFFVDFINFLIDDNYKFLFSSIAETVVKNSVYAII